MTQIELETLSAHRVHMKDIATQLKIGNFLKLADIQFKLYLECKDERLLKSINELVDKCMVLLEK